MKNMFDNILDDNEKVVKVFKPSKKKYFANNILFCGIILFMVLPLILLAIANIPNANLTHNSISLTTFLIVAGICVGLVLINVLINVVQYKNIFYCYTNKRVIIRGGVFGVDYKSLDLEMIGAINVYVSLLDRIIGNNTGAIIFGSMASPISIQPGNAYSSAYRFANISMPYDMYKEIKKHVSSHKEVIK